MIEINSIESMESRDGLNLKKLLAQSHLKVESVIECLISYKTDMEQENRIHIENFFSELKLLPKEMKVLTETGAEYEKRLMSFQAVERDTHEFFSTALGGIAKVKESLKQLGTMVESRELDAESHSSIDDLKKEYTNMTSNGSILILDDDILILSILNRGLDMNGYEVIVTSNPDEAIEIVKSGDIDLALVDLIMPGIDGFQVFESIKEHTPELPVVFITGRDRMETKVDALNRGAEDYIVKPFRIEEVVARIDSIIRRKRDYRFNVNLDELTGAYTRKCFASKIKQYLNEVSYGKKISFSFLDLDRFKDINDTYGHLIGDEVLKKFVTEAKSSLDSVKIFRFGGDEFLIVVEDSSEEKAKEQLESFRERVSRTDYQFDGLDETIRLGVSIGLTELKPEDCVSGILDRADKALYKAKEEGRNKLVAYSDIVDAGKNEKQILIIDAENVVSNLVKNRLKGFGYRVNLVEDIKDVELSKGELPNLVILDLKTYKESRAQLDGMNMLKEKVLLIISEAEKKVIRPSDVFEVDEIMVKPISVTEVEKKVRRMMS